jgi:hypothetical protein
MRLDNARYLVIALTIAVLSTASIAVQSARAEVSAQLSGTLSALPSTVTVGHAITVSFNVTNSGNATANNTTPSVISKTGTGNATCSAATPANANITAGSFHVFTFSCTASKAGNVTFSSTAMSGTVSTGSKSSNVVRIQPAQPTVTVNKHIVGGTATLANFTLILDGHSVVNGTATNVTAGHQHNVTESFPASLMYLASFSGDCNANGVINATKVVNGTNLQCTITNTFSPPTVTLIKHINGGSATLANFTLMLNGSPVVNGTAKPVSLDKQQNVSETFSPTTLSTQYNTSFSDDCNANGTINATKVVTGASLECIITNTYHAPPTPVATVTIIKHIDGGSATLANFTLTLNGQSVANGTATNVTAGHQQNVSEVFHPSSLSTQYTASFAGDCNSVGIVNATKLVTGAKLECIVTNTFNQPTVTIIKHIAGGTATLANFTLVLDGHAVTNDTATYVIIGQQQNVTEVFASSTLNYVATFSGDCDGRGIIIASKVVTGARLECTITNTFTPSPTVTVFKHIVGGTATLANFTLILDGHSVVNGTATNVTAGHQQNISETFNPSSLSSHYVSSFGGDCNSAGIIAANNVANGASLECTITNTFTTTPPHAPTVTIIKYIVGGTATLSNVQLSLDGNSVTNGTTTTVIAGQQQNITESLTPSGLTSQYNAVFSGDCSPNGTINAAAVKAGASLECVITNTFVPPGPSSLDCTSAVPSQSVIWPANHKFVAITILDVAPNGSPVTITITSIQQNQKVSGQSPDGTGITTSTAHVRADKSGEGRVYRIGFTAIDGTGNSCTGFVTVVVPHDHSGKHVPPANTPTPYDSTIAKKGHEGSDDNGNDRGNGNGNNQGNDNGQGNNNDNGNGKGHGHNNGNGHGNNKGQNGKNKDD